MALIKILKCLSDLTRLRIFFLLGKRDLCVCEIEYIMSISQTNASRHLNKLKESDLIDSKRQGQFIFYKINHEILKKHPFLNEFIKSEIKHINQTADDIKNLHKLQSKGMLCKRENCCK